MKKYRIVKRRGMYVAQRRRWLFFWTDWFDHEWGLHTFSSSSRDVVERFIAKKETK